MSRTFALLSAFVALSISACSDSTAPADCNAFRPIIIGTPAEGTLARNDCQRDDNSFQDKFQLEISQTTDVQIDLTSTQFDTFLILLDEAGVQITSDDDSGVDDNSQLIITLEPGTYTLVANSWYPLMTGGYVISVIVSP